jgi:exopolysaccharide biosynthesis polyprenyl glycosylphosphotransferase
MTRFNEEGGVRAPAHPASPDAAPLVGMAVRRPARGPQPSRHGAILADFLGVLAVMVGVNLVRFGGPTAASYPLHEYLLAFLTFAALQVAVAYFTGLYEPELRLGSRPHLPPAVVAALVAMVIVGLGQLMLGIYYVPRGTLPVVPVLSALVLAGNRWVSRARRRAREGVPRVMLVGTAQETRLAGTHLVEDGERAALVAGTVEDGKGLLTQVVAAGATDVLLLNARTLEEIYPEPLLSLERGGVGVLQRVTARDTLLGLQGVREVAGMPFVALRVHTLPRSRAHCKRFLELSALLATLPLLVPLIGAVALYVRIVAGRPVLYRQRRVGKDGTPFWMVKFRTMRQGAEDESGPMMAMGDDDRVIPACRWLRASRLDEMPQLGNVLRGEMSLVGPRPERPELTAHYQRLIPGYARRHEIPPGMTGLAQIRARYHTDPAYKLGHDLQYLVNWSPVLDLQILCRTVWVVLSSRQ